MSGIGQSMVQSAQNNVGVRAPVLMILPATALVGAIWGLLQIHILTWFLWAAGRVTNGPATFRQVRISLAWAQVPHVVLVVCWLLAAIVFGRLFFLNPDNLGLNPPMLLLAGITAVYLVSAVCVAWSLVLLVLGFAEAEGVSAWRALGTVLVTLVAFGIAALIVMLFVIRLGAIQ